MANDTPIKAERSEVVTISLSMPLAHAIWLKGLLQNALDHETAGETHARVQLWNALDSAGVR